MHGRAAQSVSRPIDSVQGEMNMMNERLAVRFAQALLAVAAAAGSVVVLQFALVVA